MTLLASREEQFFATVVCGSRVTRLLVGVVKRARDPLNGCLKHCRDVSTGTDQLSGCLASCWFVDCKSLYSLSA